MNKTTLYKKDTKGKIREWSIEVLKNEDGSATIIKTSGIKDGKLVSESKTITSGKNIGKANETSPYTQAVSDATNAITKQMKGEYVAALEDVRESGNLGTGVRPPMTAKTYDPTLKASGSKNFEKLKVPPGEYVILEDKIDGLRCETIIDETSIDFRSRTGEVYQPIPHIAKSLRETYDRLGMTGQVILDGELFTTAVSFNTLSGILRKERETPEDLAIEKELRYILYDVMLEENYNQRLAFVEQFEDTENKVDIIYFEECEFTEENVERFHQAAITERGAEGTMIRRLNAVYENKRTWQLMKYKSWIEEEFKVVGFEQMEGVDTLGAIVFETRDGKKVFNCTLNAPDDECKKVWDNQADYLPLWGTVRFQNYSEYGVPRIPKCKGFRKAPSID
jgi:ATP-dependent DNA ligase